MQPAPHSPKEPSGDAPASPSVEEVIARLDRLWDESPRASLGLAQSLVGRSIGRYVLLDVIGHGAFGIVYRAHDPQLDREVAVKIARPEVVVDREKLRRFESEAKTVASLDHPLIVPVYEAVLEGPTPFIALALVVGPDLDQCLSELAAPIPWREAVQFVAELAGAVHYAHERGVIHRDLKPSNVLLVPRPGLASPPAALKDYQPKLTDFGLAKLERSSLEDTRSSLLIGTPLYMAPEVLLSSSRDSLQPTADIYSLGCLLYELLTGRPPIVGDNYVQVIDRLREARPERMAKFRPDAPRSLDAVCFKCLEKNPQARYQTAAELAADLERILEEKPVTVRSASAVTRWKYWMSQPQRIRDAGWFSLCLNAAAVIWLTILALVMPRFLQMSPADYRATMFDAATAISNHFVLAIFGYFTILKHRWAAWLGLLASAWLVVLISLVQLGIVPIFAALYRDDPYHKIANVMVIFVTALWQVFLYAFALYAHRSLTKQ